MRVHRTILPRVVFQIENLINLDQIPSKVKLLALPAKWWSGSASPFRQACSSIAAPGSRCVAGAMAPC
jgi:kynurenine formamidase